MGSKDRGEERSHKDLDRWLASMVHDAWQSLTNNLLPFADEQVCVPSWATRFWKFGPSRGGSEVHPSLMLSMLL